MLRIPRKELDAAVEAFMIACRMATNTAGQKILFTLDLREATAAVLGAMSIVAPHGGPCTAADTFFVHTPPGGTFGKDSVQWPPDLETGTITVEERP